MKQKKTPFNQLLRDIKDRTYPNRVAKRMRAHPALRWNRPTLTSLIARAPAIEFPSSEKAVFTQDWFLSRAAWPVYFENERTNVREYLEVGVFEGRSLLYAADLFPNASLTAIDTFDGGDQLSDKVTDNLESRFSRNIAPVKDRVRVLKGTSLQRLAELSGDIEKYDAIYIDGSHFHRHVLLDTFMAWPLLKTGGILIWDDYGWSREHYRGKNPAPAIDHFLDVYEGDYKVIFATDQVAIRKTRSELTYFSQS